MIAPASLPSSGRPRLRGRPVKREHDDDDHDGGGDDDCRNAQRNRGRRDPQHRMTRDEAGTNILISKCSTRSMVNATSQANHGLGEDRC